MRRYSQPRNYGFNTAVGSGYALGKNTIAPASTKTRRLWTVNR